MTEATAWWELDRLRRIDAQDGLLLRPLAGGDGPALVAILQQDPTIRQRVSVAAGVESADDIDRVINPPATGLRMLRYAICRGRSRELVGMMTLWRAGDFFGELADPDDYGFGYFLSPAARGQGIIPKALTALMDVVASSLPVHSFIAFCEDDNPASAGNLRKAGFARTDVTFVNSKGWRERKYERLLAGR